MVSLPLNHERNNVLHIDVIMVRQLPPIVHPS